MFDFKGNKIRTFGYKDVEFNGKKINFDNINDTGSREFPGARPKFSFVGDDGKKYIVKFGDQSHAEILFLEDIAEEDKRYFVLPVATYLDSEDKERSFIVQELLDFIDIKDVKRGEERDNFIAAHWSVLEDIAEKYEIQDDISSFYNWGYLPDHGPVIFDYGLNLHLD